MDSQAVILSSRATHIREFKTENERLRRENAALRNETESLLAHLDFALLALHDLKTEPLELWDGWNLVLSADKLAKSREELIAQAIASGRRIWIVFDGHDEKSKSHGLVRVSYTGGCGEHRADRFILAFARTAKYLGLLERVKVKTFDKDFLKAFERLCR